MFFQLILHPMPTKAPSPQALLIDADDTLWENNIYFEQAIADFMRFLNHQELTHAQVRQVINEVEHETIREHGYGSHSFARSLIRTFERLSADPITPALHDTISSFSYRISEYPLQLIDGVTETLEYLQERKHRLMLMTKGNFAEQTAKVERSGLRDFFATVEIVAEKNAPVYTSIVAKHRLEPERTWMVGNSPKSDINPALAAGINAVFVPHDMTWVLEHEPVASPPEGTRLLHVERFSDLQHHF
ncbi:MAG TPA: HAD family hydrolase [Alphaproteobacteria bacterium]|nr:HAD family hydrolase [Alphaproteobacteria bacterium]